MTVKDTGRRVGLVSEREQILSEYHLVIRDEGSEHLVAELIALLADLNSEMGITPGFYATRPLKEDEVAHFLAYGSMS